MLNLVESYGTWILFAVLFLAMLWMHAGHLRHGSHRGRQDSDNLEDQASDPGVDESSSRHGRGRGGGCH